VNIKKGKMMKHAAKISGKFGVLGKLAAALALGFAMNAAHANDVITFEGLDSGVVGDSDYFIESGVMVTAYSNVADSAPGDLVGAIVDGKDLSTCFSLACPTNDNTTFYAGLNDGYLELDTTKAGQSIHVYGLDASFLGIGGNSYPAVAGLLQIQGFYASGGSATVRYNLAGPTGGNFDLQHFTTSTAFASQAFAAVDIFAYVCDTSGSCKAFQTDGAQFTVDNIDLGPSAVSAVPEPGSWLMLGLGLVGITAAARRRHNKRA
jgi:hypothetical protein